MMDRLNEYLRTSTGKAVAIGVAVLLLALMIYQIQSNLGDTDAQAAARTRTFICAETGKAFTARVEEGKSAPVPSPHSGKNTGYLPEYCYWTKDGSISKKPTLVVLNEYAGKPGETFCPTCDRRVVKDNPSPMPGFAPPTRAELENQSEARQNRGVQR